MAPGKSTVVALLNMKANVRRSPRAPSSIPEAAPLARGLSSTVAQRPGPHWRVGPPWDPSAPKTGLPTCPSALRPGPKPLCSGGLAKPRSRVIVLVCQRRGEWRRTQGIKKEGSDPLPLYKKIPVQSARRKLGTSKKAEAVAFRTFFEKLPKNTPKNSFSPARSAEEFFLAFRGVSDPSRLNGF